MEKDEFKCHLCKETFTKGISNEEAEQEFKKLFPDCTEEEKVIVCDDCFEKITDCLQ